MRSLQVGVFVALVFAVGIAAQTDPRMGTWKMNPAESKYNTDPPKSQTVKYESAEGGFKFTADTVPANGQPTHNETIAKADGKEYAVKGSANVATRTYTKIDDRTWKIVDKLHNGKPGLTHTEVLSADGKTLTVTNTGINVQGQKVNNVVVYNKQ